jgi:glycosyltransferase involved in cell wall biosynthesis
MSLVVHLIPFNGIGGVERAADSLRALSNADIEFRVETIFPPIAEKKSSVLWNPIFFLVAIVRLLPSKPDLLIVSLWRAYALGIVLKLLRPKIRLVIFLHSPSDAHKLDRFLTRLAARLASNVWADSQASLALRLPGLVSDKAKVISFVTERINPLPARSVSPTFVFWGRLHVHKGLSRALNIFAAILDKQPTACFWIIGPDGGDLDRLRAELVSKNLSQTVEILGPKSFFEIKEIACSASFYLQTSELEGMAMSVVEAMQLGLVPVVTPVGEIKNYALHKENAVIVTNDIGAVADVLDLTSDPERFMRYRESAINTWATKPLYRDDVLEACRQLIKAYKEH